MVTGGARTSAPLHPCTAGGHSTSELLLGLRPVLHSVLYMGAQVHVALHMDLTWEVGRIALASAEHLNHLQVRVFRITSGSPL
jgi:hypothetical protein